MPLSNDFTEKTRSLWIFRYDCDICGCNRNLELHHILGRISNSPLNASLLCNSCHYRNHSQQPFTEEEKMMILQKTIKWLLKNNYQFSEKDNIFILNNKKYYDQSIIN